LPPDESVWVSGLRLGYLIAADTEDIAGAEIKSPWTVSSAAQAAESPLLAIRDGSNVRRQAQESIAESAVRTASLRKNGFALGRSRVLLPFEWAMLVSGDAVLYTGFAARDCITSFGLPGIHSD